MNSITLENLWSAATPNGAATASVITYVMPVVALLLGVGLLGETLTTGAIAGLILIALGAWLATGRPTPATPKTSA